MHLSCKNLDSHHVLNTWAHFVSVLGNVCFCYCIDSIVVIVVSAHSYLLVISCCGHRYFTEAALS